MTFEERQRVRRLIDEARRAQLKKHLAAHHKDGLCRGCGLPYQEQTPGCKACDDRRRRREGRKVAARVECDTCGKQVVKQSIQRRQTHRGIPRCYDCIRAACTGCGQPADTFTRGCVACRSRHYRRRKALEAREKIAA